MFSSAVQCARLVISKYYKSQKFASHFWFSVAIMCSPASQIPPPVKKGRDKVYTKGFELFESYAIGWKRNGLKIYFWYNF